MHRVTLHKSNEYQTSSKKLLSESDKTMCLSLAEIWNLGWIGKLCVYVTKCWEYFKVWLHFQQDYFRK